MATGTTLERERAADAAHTWRERPWLAGALRSVIAGLPIVLATATSFALVRLVPQPESALGFVAFAGLTLAVSTFVLLVTERLSRRLVPLSLLLRMSMMFPDQAPPRYRVARRAASVRHLREQVERAQAKGRSTTPIRAAEDILTLIAGLTVHDRRTRGHCERVRVYTDLLTEQLGLNPRDREKLRWASLIHDIGKLEVPEAILNKRGRPTESEWETLRAHPAEGARIAAGLLPWLGEWGRAIEHHHERWDGAGYPHGLAGDQISAGGRVVAVADAYETMTAVRSYKSAMTHVAARQELARCAGSQFDPNVVRAFLDIPLTHLVRVAGPISWLVQLPLLRHLQPLAQSVAPQLSASGATLATAAVVGATAVASSPGTMVGHGHAHHAGAEAGVAASHHAVAEIEAAADTEVGDADQVTADADPRDAGPRPDRRDVTEAPADDRADDTVARSGADPRPPQRRTPTLVEAPSQPDAVPSPAPTSGIGDLAEQVADDLGDTVEGALEAVEDEVGPAAGEVRETLDEIASVLPELGPTPTPAEAVRDAIRTIEDEVQDPTEPVEDTVAEVAEDLSDAIDEVLSSPPTAPTLPSEPSLPPPPVEVPLPLPTGGGLLG